MGRNRAGPLEHGYRQLRLLGAMICRRWNPTAAERDAQVERMAWRATASDLQRRAAAEFRWTLVREHTHSSAGEIERDE